MRPYTMIFVLFAMAITEMVIRMPRQGLKPPPKDFTADGVRNTLNRESMFSIIKHGKAGTAMVAWQSRLDDDAIYAIVDYILEAFMASGKALSETRGYEIYHGSCSVCHGDDGAAAKWAGSSLKPPPRDFTSEQSRRTLNKDIIAHAVKEGRPGTAMTSFRRQLSDEDINAVADYILAAFLAPTDK